MLLPLGLPPGLRGNGRLIRVSPAIVKAAERGCPAQVAAKARPGLYAERRVRRADHFLETFPLGPVQAALDALEFPGSAVTRQAVHEQDAALHPGLARFAAHAVRHYRPYVHGPDDPELRPVRHRWVAKRCSGSLTWEQFLWGRCYESPDGTFREFRFLSLDTAHRPEQMTAEVAIAAHTAAIGAPTPWPAPREWKRPLEPSGPPPAPGQIRRVRIVEIGLSDGSHAVLFDGDPDAAKAAYDRQARGLLTQAVAGGPPVPGASCADCKALAFCPEPVHVPGLLGIAAAPAPLRTLSASDLRYHDRCPTQYHLRSINLPKAYEYSAANERGQAVHAWLERTHRAAVAPCTAMDTPRDQESWTAGGWTVTGEQARMGVRMRAYHADVCPFRHRITNVQPEPTLTFFDAHANTVILAKPDLLYSEEGSPVWRETKTRQANPVRHQDIMRRFPQLALAVLLLHRGALKGDRASSRVELEVLYPDRIPDLYYLDPSDPDDVEEARKVLYALVRSWHADTTYPARPDKVICRSCPVSRWCPDAALPKEN